MSDNLAEQIPLSKNRKRILEHSEDHEEETASRKQAIFNDWSDTFGFLRNPSKKGAANSEKDFTDLINQGLANTFDDSLNCLGLDDGGTYDMSEQISALSNVAFLKQEAVSPHKSSAASSIAGFDENAQCNTTDKILRILNMDSGSESTSPSICQLLQQQVYSDCYGSAPSGHTTPESFLTIEENLQGGASASSDQIFASSSEYEAHRFQYILGAATSVATKLNEETLTYLNQGQPYEIKVKKLGDITKCQGKLYHTKIRICFHERRLQYMEKEHLEGWKLLRPGERIAEIDVPLSYGATDIVQSPKLMNCCEFDWDPSKEVGIYIKVNCVSTEFTPKKHGGEKGVPFRIQVETYSKVDNGLERLHICACQIKVFKLKGAERKHKQDKEKIQKRPLNGKEKFQEQCECTILHEISLDSMHIPSAPEEHSESPTADDASTAGKLSSLGNSQEDVSVSEDTKETQIKSPKPIPIRKTQSTCTGRTVSTTASAAETAAWLTSNRFSKHVSVFANFSGSDILRLSRAELREICGLADGIRLYNSLHSRTIAPRLTLYVCCENDHVYNAVYLEDVTYTEFVHKICHFVCVPPERVVDVYLSGPNGIDILVTDQVLANMEDEAMLVVQALQDTSGEHYRLILRPASSKASKA